MENIIFTTLQNESSARALVSQFEALETLGDIVIYNIAVLLKEGNDNYRLVSQQGESTTAFPAAGAITGMVIGALAGPLGMGMGALAGMMTGDWDEDQLEGLQDHIVREKAATMQAGDYVVILDVEEDNTAILDSYLKNSDYTRTPVAQEWNAFDQEQLAIEDKEIADAEEKWKHAVGEEKATLKAKIDKLKAQRDASRKKAKETLHLSIKNLQEKIHHLEEKIKISGEKSRLKMTAVHVQLKQQLLKLSERLTFAFS